MSQEKQWFVYENLNDPGDRLILSDDQIVAGVYLIVGGPFQTRQEAEDFAKPAS